MKNYETERLILKPTSAEDASFLLELMNTPKWLQFIGDRGVKTIEDAENYIQQNYVLQRERVGYSTFTVLYKKNHEKLGLVGLYDRESIEGIDLGFAFLEKHEGRGYAFEASKKLMELSFGRFGLSELKAITDVENYSSRNLLEKLGFEEIGFLELAGEKRVLLFQKTKLD